jgi:hypothetical protein
MATGDLDNNLVKLRTELVKIKFPVKKLPSDECVLTAPPPFFRVFEQFTDPSPRNRL